MLPRNEYRSASSFVLLIFNVYVNMFIFRLDYFPGNSVLLLIFIDIWYFESTPSILLLCCRNSHYAIYEGEWPNFNFRCMLSLFSSLNRAVADSIHFERLLS